MVNKIILLLVTVLFVTGGFLNAGELIQLLSDKTRYIGYSEDGIIDSAISKPVNVQNVTVGGTQIPSTAFKMVKTPDGIVVETARVIIIDPDASQKVKDFFSKLDKETEAVVIEKGPGRLDIIADGAHYVKYIIRVNIKIWPGGSDLDNGEENRPCPGDSDSKALSELVENKEGCFILVNWDNDNSNSNFITDLDKQNIQNEDNLARVKIEFTPNPMKGKLELFVYQETHPTIRIWDSKNKSNLLFAGGVGDNKAFEWDLTTQTPLENLWVEGLANSNKEKDTYLILRYLRENEEVDYDITPITVIMINLGNGVYREAEILNANRGHGAIPYKYVGECNKADLSNDRKFLILNQSLNDITGDKNLTFQTKNPGQFTMGCYTNVSALNYNKRLKVLSSAMQFLQYTIPWCYEDCIRPENWDGKISTIEEERCEGPIEASYEINGIDVWGKERSVENNVVHYDVTDQSDNWEYGDITGGYEAGANELPDNLEEHNDYDTGIFYGFWNDTLQPSTQCGWTTPERADTKFTKQNLCIPVGAKGGN